MYLIWQPKVAEITPPGCSNHCALEYTLTKLAKLRRPDRRQVMSLHADQDLLVSFASPADSLSTSLTALDIREDQLDGQVSSTKNSGHMDTRQKSDEKESEIKGDFNGRRDNCRSISVRIQDVWETQVKLEQKGELNEIEWNLYYQAARWPRRIHILGEWREKVVPKVGVPRQERFIEWAFGQIIWIVSFCLCCILYLC
jgi:hypothetical protein